MTEHHTPGNMLEGDTMVEDEEGLEMRKKESKKDGQRSAQTWI